ncbi:MAG: DnaD domain protein [Clostridia bacterium]|nr:DnaD domain protein [Clostridia bacterium]
MAQKRMFAKSVVDSDMFLDMSPQSQALYFHLAIKADDEGFTSGPNRVLRMLGLGREHLDELAESGFIYLFESGICLIRHWHLHNAIRKDRSAETIYQEERSRVFLDKSRIYVKAAGYQCEMTDACPSSARQMPAQERIEENRLDERREEGGASLSESKLNDYFKENPGIMPFALTAKAFTRYLKQMDYECVIYAIGEARESKKRSMGYVRAVLDRLLAEGITSQAQLNQSPKIRHGPRSVDEGTIRHQYTQEDYESLIKRMEEL